MRTMVTLLKMNRFKDKVTLLKLNHHKDKINESDAETCTINVQEVVDPKNKERNKLCNMKIPATPLVALAVFVVAAVIIGFCLVGNERKCSMTPALMTFNGATFEIYPLEANEEKHKIPGSDKANVDFEKVSSTSVHHVYRVENPFDMSTMASPGATTSSINGLCQQDKPAKERNSCGDLL